MKTDMIKKYEPPVLRLSLALLIELRWEPSLITLPASPPMAPTFLSPTALITPLVKFNNLIRPDKIHLKTFLTEGYSSDPILHFV